MLVIGGRIRIDPKDRDKAVAAATAMMRESNKEAGCISYTLSGDLEDPGLFRIFEEWEDAEALKAHFKAPHMAEFNKVIASLKVLEVDVKQYDVSDTKQLMP